MNAREYFEGRSQAAEIAESKGFRGFAVIPHPYRVTEAGKQQYRAVDPDYGIWVWLRNDVGEMERYIYWSPHYHIVGPTSSDMEPGDGGSGWVYSFIRSLESFEGMRDEESHEDMYGVFRYILSHAGFPAGSTKQIVTWYGSLANSVFVEEATESWQHEKPSEGVMSVLKREIEEVADVEIEEEEGDGPEVPTDDNGECPVEECDGVLIDVFDVTAYLRQVDPPPDVRETMIAARDWRLGRVLPPPGLKRPQTEEAAREAFEALS